MIDYFPMIRDKLQTLLLDFLETVYQCATKTLSTSDKQLFTNDLLTVCNWLIKLHRGEEVTLIACEIVDCSTTKQFTDYWKGDPWGSLECEALNQLQKQIFLAGS